MTSRSLNNITSKAISEANKKNNSMDNSLFGQIMHSQKVNGFSDSNNSIDIEKKIGQRMNQSFTQDKER